MKGVSLEAFLDLDTEGPDGGLIKLFLSHYQLINKNLAERKKRGQDPSLFWQGIKVSLKKGKLTEERAQGRARRWLSI